MYMAGLTPTAIAYALAGGVVPTFAWLYFWLKQTQKAEPRSLIILSFIVGIIVVPITIPIQHIAHDYYGTWKWFVFVVAGIEELTKFLFIRMIIFRNRLITAPSDYTIYLIACALGFAALENSLYLLQPIIANNIPMAINTGNLRFLGSTVIHSVSSASLGLWLGLAFCTDGIKRMISVIVGCATAIALHGIFNYFIIDSSTSVVAITITVAWMAMAGIVFALQQASQMSSCPVPDQTPSRILSYE